MLRCVLADFPFIFLRNFCKKTDRKLSITHFSTDFHIHLIQYTNKKTIINNGLHNYQAICTKTKSNQKL